MKPPRPPAWGEAGGWRDNLLSDWDAADAELFDLINSEIRLDFKQRVSVRSKSCDEKSKERRIERSLMSNSMRNGTRRHHQDRQHHSSGPNKLYTVLTHWKNQLDMSCRLAALMTIIMTGHTVSSVKVGQDDTRRSRSCVTETRENSGERTRSGGIFYREKISSKIGVSRRKLLENDKNLVIYVAPEP